MRKKEKIKKKDQIAERCDYCKYNQGVNQKFGYMWHCSHLPFCVVFNLNHCRASRLSKGKFEKDNEKYQDWLKKEKAKLKSK